MIRAVEAELEERLRRAYEARLSLHEDPQLEAYRLFHGYGEGGPGLLIDRYGDVALIENRGASASEVEIAAKVLQELETFSCIVLKERGKEPRALLGTLPSTAVAIVEHGLLYSIETWAPRNPGLYLDARPARAWLRENSEGRRVLNLFSYAGSLGVAAMAGGARGVIHVDTQKRALKRCSENHRLNGQRTDARDLKRLDVPTMLGLQAKVWWHHRGSTSAGPGPTRYRAHSRGPRASPRQGRGARCVAFVFLSPRLAQLG